MITGSTFINSIVFLSLFSFTPQVNCNSMVEICVEEKIYKSIAFIDSSVDVKKSILPFFSKKEIKTLKKSKGSIPFRISEKIPGIDPLLFENINCLDLELFKKTNLNGSNRNLNRLSKDKSSNLVLHFYPIVGNSVLCQFVRYRNVNLPYEFNALNGRQVNILFCFNEKNEIIDYTILTIFKG